MKLSLLGFAEDAGKVDEGMTTTEDLLEDPLEDIGMKCLSDATLKEERLEREEKEFFLDFVLARFGKFDCGVLFTTTAEPRLLLMKTFGIKPKFSS